MKNRHTFEQSMRGRSEPGLWKLLASGRPVPIPKLFRALYTDTPDFTPRKQHQRVGATVSRLNARMQAYRTGTYVAPGRPRGTYQLYTSR